MADAPEKSDEPTETSEVPSAQDDAARIAADEARLEKVEGEIRDARQTHEETKKSWQSGMIPEVEGDEGEADASPLQT